MTTNMTLPVAIEFAPSKDGKSMGNCMVHITQEQMKDFERLRRRGAVSIALVIELPKEERADREELFSTGNVKKFLTWKRFGL